MKIIFALLALILVVFSGYHLSFRQVKSRLHLTGIEFIFLGILLGPQFINLLDKHTCQGLAPLMGLVSGWIGLLYGFQFEISKIKRFNPSYIVALHLDVVLSFAVVFGAVWFLFPFLFPQIGPRGYLIPLILGVTAVCSSQTGISLMAEKFRQYSHRKIAPMVRLLQFIAGTNGLLALLLLCPAFKIDFLHGIVAGLILVVLFLLLLPTGTPAEEKMLILMGMSAITAGIGLAFGFSPLLANFMIGFLLANIMPNKAGLFEILTKVEKPFYLLILVFLGAAWQFNAWWPFLAGFLYWVLRLIGKLLGGYVFKVVNRNDRLPGFGMGLLEQGGLAPALLFDCTLNFPLAGPFMIGIVMTAVICNELSGPYFLRRLLIKTDAR